MTPMSHAFRGLAAAGLFLLATACVAPVGKLKGAPLYFPPAPELPRVQYLTSFSGLKDVEKQTAFNRFVVGEKQDVKLDKPYGVGIHDGKIYVCDTNATVVVFDLKRKVFEKLSGAVGPGKLVQPTNISIEADGTKYVADPARGQVVVFDADDQYVKAYGEPGDWRPVDAVAFENRLYVADFSNHVVKVFDKAGGELVKTIGDKGETIERLDRPTNLAFDAEGDLYVTDFARFQVVKFDRDGHYKSAFGKSGDGPGHFARPKGIAVDRKGQLFAVDASFNNVQIFNKGGRVLLYFGQGGENPGELLLPAKVTLDYDNLDYFRDYVDAGFQAESLVLVTSQFGPHAVTVLAYGYEKGKQYPTDEELLRQIEERQKKELEKLPKEAPESQKAPDKPTQP
jgi:DNA-binding beta-propeller fold protein YncE